MSGTGTNVCPSNGNQGVPISFRGVLKRDNLDVNYGDVKREIQLRTALSIRSTPRKFLDANGFIEDNANDTLFIDRVPYSLQTVQLCRHWTTVTEPTTIQPTSESPIEAFAELVFSFKKAYADYGGAGVQLVIVPIATQDSQYFNADVDAYFSDLLNQTVPRVKSLEPFFSGKTLRIGYQTCIELQNPGDGAVSALNIGVIVCPGVEIKTKTAEDLKTQFKSRIPEFILPSFAHPGLNTAELKPGTTVSRWSAFGKTYTTSRDLSSKQFLVFDNDITPNAPTPTAVKVDANGLRTTQQYKCVPLDRLKDVSGNLVLLDPATGARTLADTLRDEDEVNLAELKDVMATKPNDGTLSSGVIFLFTALAVLLAFVLVGAVYYYIFERSGDAANTAIANAANIAIATAANTGRNAVQAVVAPNPNP